MTTRVPGWLDYTRKAVMSDNVGEAFFNVLTCTTSPWTECMCVDRDEGPRGKIFVDYRAVEKKERDHCLYKLPFLSGQREYVSCRDTIQNVATAVLERVMYHETANGFSQPRVPRCDRVVAVLHKFRRRLSYFARPSAPVPLLEYPATAYSGRKLALYERAAKKVQVTGPLEKYSMLSTFLKHEKLPVTGKRIVPRVIQPRKPEYNVCVGRYLHHLEPVLYNDIARVFGRPTVMKGFNAFKVGSLLNASWVSFRDPRAVGLDASRFDQHISYPLLCWEHAIYCGLYYPGHPELQALLSYQLDNRGFARTWNGTMKYTVRGGRCSGDMNTACGNCLIMCAAVYGLLRSLGLTYPDGTTKVHLFNNGDDCILMGERSHIELLVPQVHAWFDMIGLVMKVEAVVDTLEQVSFCQTRPIYDGVEWRVVREVDQSFSKDAHLIDRPLNDQHLKELLHCIGSCGLSLTSGLPVLQEYYLSMRRGGVSGGTPSERVLGSGFYRLAQGIAVKEAREVSEAARVSFCRAFGITPDCQRELELQLRSYRMPLVCTVTDESVPTTLYF